MKKNAQRRLLEIDAKISALQAILTEASKERNDDVQLRMDELDQARQIILAELTSPV